MLSSVWRNRQLILQMTKREVVGRYRGSVMGLAWSFFNPLLMLLVYTFFFSVVFNSRWNGSDSHESQPSFAIILFVGMIIHGLFAECINRAPALIVTNVSYVKKVVFPLEILPWVSMGAALFHATLSFFVLLGAQLLLVQKIAWTLVYFPLVFLPLILTTMGLSWFFSALGVYMRDVSQTVGIFTSVLMFLSPVFYPVSALPERYHIWIKLNPLTTIIEEGRKVFVFGIPLDWKAWIATMAVGGVFAWLGFCFFQKSRRGFADVL